MVLRFRRFFPVDSVPLSLAFPLLFTDLCAGSTSPKRLSHRPAGVIKVEPSLLQVNLLKNAFAPSSPYNKTELERFSSFTWMAGNGGTGEGDRMGRIDGEMAWLETTEDCLELERFRTWTAAAEATLT